MGSAVRDRLGGGKPTRLASPPRKHLGSQPDAAGHATRLATARLQEAGIVLEPLLRKAGLRR